MPNWSIKELRKKLDSKEVSATEVAHAYLDRIKETEDKLNSFVTVIDDEHVIRKAEHAQKEIDSGNASALTGIPYAAKDLFCTKGVLTTACSGILTEYIPAYTATVIERLGDAVLLGKTNMDDGAMGSSTETSFYGPTFNPYNLDHVPGGSSGGSAAAVAAGQAVFALGSDTAGSVRQPASFCNVVGFKPTYGRISRYGMLAMASSFDTVGYMTKTVEDSASLLELVAGPDHLDATAPDRAVDTYTADLETGISGMKIGIVKEYMEVEGLSPEMRERFDNAVEKLQKEGAEIIDISLPNTKYNLPAYYIICPSEVSSNLARFDGIQFSWRHKEAQNLDEIFMKTRDAGFGKEPKRRILTGTFALSSGSYDAYYKKASQVRTLIRRDFEEAYKKVDVIFAPVSPFSPFKFNEKMDDPLQMYAADVYTVPANMAGIPSISVPVEPVNGLPAGMQFMAPQFEERKLFQAAAALEAISDTTLELAV